MRVRSGVGVVVLDEVDGVDEVDEVVDGEEEVDEEEEEEVEEVELDDLTPPTEELLLLLLLLLLPLLLRLPRRPLCTCACSGRSGETAHSEPVLTIHAPSPHATAKRARLQRAEDCSCCSSTGITHMHTHNQLLQHEPLSPAHGHSKD